jgi:very-short-patch-repair endonuclease
MQWILIGLGLLLIVIIKALLHRTKKEVDFSMFQKCEKVMNTSEQKLFEELLRVFSSDYIVLSKVRIEDFVEAKSYSARGKIKSRHVDFLICDQLTTAPLLAIELDGGIHRKPSVHRRDLFVNELYLSINLPIHRINVGADFLKEVSSIKSTMI